MTSMPASRKARAMILAPRSWPSSPGLATTTRILPFGGASADTVSDLQDDGVALPAAGADRGAAVAAAAPAQLVDERADDARAGSADRVSERDGATVDVDLVLVFQAGLLQSLLGGRCGSASEVGEVVGRLGVNDDLGQRLLAVGGGPLLGGDD